MPCEQNARQNHNIKTCDKPFEGVTKFKYLGTLANQNCIPEEIKSRLLPFYPESCILLIPKNMKFKI